MGERRGTKGLELWCRRMTEGYPGVNVVNMTTSWRDGLAFCAIIHHFRPDLIEFSKLNKDDIYHNNELAFRVAERHLGIPALLEPEDMVEYPVPDRLSILTYLSQFYQTFVVGQGKSPPRIAPKRPQISPEDGLVSPTSTSPPTKVAFPSAGKIRREPCAKCGLPVFIAERLNVGKLLYHRTCFRCARCNSQLTLANYYETENNEFCCETCPDEEKLDSSVLTRSLSDEEKSATLKKDDEYSAKFETALEFPEDSISSEYTKARSCFINSQVELSDSGNEEPPDLPKTKPPEIVTCEDTFSDSGFPNGLKTNVNKDSVSLSSTSKLEESHDIVTKDTISAEGNTNSLVKARMRLFESKSDASNENTVNNQVPSTNIEDSFKDNTLNKDSVTQDSIITISDSNTTDSVIVIEESQEAVDETSLGKTREQTSSETSLGETEQQTSSVIEIPDESTRKKDEYPDDLNPFGDDLEEKPSLNPFEDEEDDLLPPNPQPAARKKIKPSTEDKEMSTLYIQRVSVNPFEEENEKPQPAQRKLVPAPRISLNPFWSDDEENEEAKPVPKPRISKSSASSETKSSSAFGSSSSLTSQSGSTLRKKKLAPKPPESGQSSLTSSPCHSVNQSPRGTPKIRKAKKAPLPPVTSTPIVGSQNFEDFEKEKSVKDEQNRNRQSQNLQSPSSSENSSSLSAPNKSTFGKWKRRKGQAPSRPIPQRRTIKSIPMNEVRQELELIEIQQQGLEKQGVRLEQIIRERCEGPGVNPDDALAPEIEEMVLQLFELVNEKNELFRRQAELMYLRRQQKLEEEHADIEYQIRCLMLQPEANKTDSDKAREEELINRLVEIVERRNEIIECLEMDRVREAEEDDSINNQLNLYTLKKEECVGKKEKKEKKKHKKEKKFKLKGHKVDADKDIDESESSTSSVKDKKKKKFNIF